MTQGKQSIKRVLLSTGLDLAAAGGDRESLRRARDRVRQAVGDSVDFDKFADAAVTRILDAAEAVVDATMTRRETAPAEPTASPEHAARPEQAKTEPAVDAGDDAAANASVEWLTEAGLEHLREGDRVLVAGVVKATMGTDQVLVEIFSKTDQYNAWVRGDLVVARDVRDVELEVGASYAARAEDDRDTVWMYLPRGGQDPKPFLTMSGPRLGKRSKREKLPTLLTEVACSDLP